MGSGLAGGSLAFMPDTCGVVLQKMFDDYGDRIWSIYGFRDAFHPKQKWYSRYVLGIDQGVVLLMVENARSEGIWQAVMSTAEAKRAMKAVGFSVIAS